MTTCVGKAENEQWVSSVDIVYMTVEQGDSGGNETPYVFLRGRGGEVESHGSRADMSSGQADASMALKWLLWAMVMVQVPGRMRDAM